MIIRHLKMGCSIILEENGILTDFNETASGKEVMRVDSILFSLGNFDKTKYHLWDFTKSKSINISGEEMKMIGTLNKCASAWNNKIAIAIVTKDSKLKKLIEIYKKEIADTQWLCELFGDLSSARKWINSVLSN